MNLENILVLRYAVVDARAMGMRYMAFATETG